MSRQRRATLVMLAIVDALAGCSAAPIDVATLAPDSLTEGQVAHWRFDDNIGDIELVSGNAKVTLDLESSLSEDRLAISRVRLRSGKTSIDGSGEVSSLAARRGVFTTTADPLDLDEVLAIGFPGGFEVGAEL